MKKTLLSLFAVGLLFVSCSTSKTVTTRGELYPLVYEEQPQAIAIMPPINQTTHAEAKDFFFTTLYMPLCEKGYYVFSPYLTMELFQQESAYDAELFLEQDLSTFKSFLGADAVMFTIIKDWRRANAVGTIRANVEYILRSTKTGKTLYRREGDVTVDMSVHSSSAGGGLLGALVNLAATAAVTAATDKVEAGRICNNYVLSDLPAGRYSTLFQKDMEMTAGPEKITKTVRP